MAAFRSRHRRGGRWWLIGTTLAAAAAFMAVFVTASGANLTGSTFEGSDGNLVVNTSANTDWANVAGLNTGVDKPAGNTDNSFGQGTKEDNSAVSVVTGSIPPNKNDLTRFYEASELAPNNHEYLYLGWERLVNIGNANLDFEISQKSTTGFTSSTTGPVTLNRTAGDLLVTYDFSGSGTPTLGLNFWLTAAAGNTVGQCFSANSLPCWGKHVNLSGSASEGAVNTGNIVDPLQTGSPTLGAGLFGEAAIDLTNAGVFPPGTCESFGSTFAKSRSSSSFTAEIKDFIAPVPVSISNCGSITIHKVTENGDSSFGYTTTGGLSPGTFSLGNGGSQPYTSLQQGSYSVTENLTATQTAAGWTLKSLNCTSSGTGTSTSTSSGTASITLGPAGTVDCTYTNHLTLSPSIATTLSEKTGAIGDTVHDSSALSGASADAGGTVTYTAYTDSSCTQNARDAGTKTVTNDVVPDSNGLQFNHAGTFYWQAVYSGDSNNNGATSTCTDEKLVIAPNSPSIATTLSANPVDVGSTVHDSATLTGATGSAGGTVTYTVYTDNACTTGARDAGTVNVTNGGVPDSNGLLFSTAGDFYWQAVYSGDADNNGKTSACTSEHLVVNKVQPGASTAQNLIPNDSFTLSGATSTAGGTITLSLYAPSDTTCSGTPALTQTVNVSGNGTYSTTNTTFIASTEGTWRWQSSYSGDANNKSATSSCGTERFIIANS